MIPVSSTVCVVGVGFRVEGLGLCFFFWLGGLKLLVFWGPTASMTVYPTFYRTYP